jgi:hypothetical protein
MVDPDATSRRNPTMREWRHWMVINIPGTRVGKGDVVTKYEVSFFLLWVIKIFFVMIFISHCIALFMELYISIENL